MNNLVRIHLEKAILVGSQRYSKVLIGEARPEADLTQSGRVLRTFEISGYIVSYKYHALTGPTVYNLAESNILAVNEYTVPGNTYAERNVHEFLARQLFAVPEDRNLSPRQYDDAKKIGLGLGYGMSEDDLAGLLKRPVHQVKELLDRYLGFLGVDRSEPWRATSPEARLLWKSAGPIRRRCATPYQHGAHRYKEPGGSPDFQCPGNPATDYPIKQCSKQFDHARHNYRNYHKAAEQVNTTCLGRDH